MLLNIRSSVVIPGVALCALLAHGCTLTSGQPSQPLPSAVELPQDAYDQDRLPDIVPTSGKQAPSQPEALPYGTRRVLAKRFSVALSNDWQEVSNDHGALIVFSPRAEDGGIIDVYREAVLVDRKMYDAWCRQYAASMSTAPGGDGTGGVCGREVVGSRDVCTVTITRGNRRQHHMLLFTNDGVYILVLTTTVERESVDHETLALMASSLTLLDTEAATVAAMERLRYRFTPPADWLVKVVDGEAHMYRPIVDAVRHSMTGIHISWLGERYESNESRHEFMATFRESVLDRFFGADSEEFGVQRSPWVYESTHTLGQFSVSEISVAGMAVADDPVEDTCYRIAVLFGKRRTYIVTLLARLGEGGELAQAFNDVLSSFSER